MAGIFRMTNGLSDLVVDVVKLFEPVVGVDALAGVDGV